MLDRFFLPMINNVNNLQASNFKFYYNKALRLCSTQMFSVIFFCDIIAQRLDLQYYLKI